jgi:hypothetical protein
MGLKEPNWIVCGRCWRGRAHLPMPLLRSWLWLHQRLPGCDQRLVGPVPTQEETPK